MDELTERQKEILRQIVGEYVRTPGVRASP
jgi:transcriptional regulator of heat shock response